MSERARYRVADALDAIEQINKLLESKSFEDVQTDRPLKAAFERFLEILSEAARHLPPELKFSESSIPWRKVADIGNHLRHAYHRVDAEILWTLYDSGMLDELSDALHRMSRRLETGR